jgi:exopolysaccharide biosynthesis operon protein EpsL
VQSDSNLFRLPAATDTNALLGRSGDERISIATLGLGFKSQQSLQDFEANVSVSNYRYQNFDYLNFTAANYDLKWLWALTPRFTGSLISDRKETQNSFADVARGDRRRNVRLDASTGLETSYEVDGPWRFVAGVSTTKQTNQEAAVAGSDYSYTTADLGLRYVFPSGSSMTYLAKLNNGDYFNAVFPNNAYLDNTYKQFEHDFRLHWTWSGLSTADVYATHLERNHPNYPSRDFSGWNTGASVYYAASGKLSVLGTYRHELSVYATGDSNFTKTDRLTIIPTWQIGPKTSVKLQFDTADIQYEGTPGNAIPSQRRDTTRDTSLSLNWQPSRQWNLSSGLQNLTRNSNLANLDYESNVLFLAGQFNY